MFRSMITRLVLVGLTAAIVGLPEVALGLPRATSEWVVEGHERNASFGTSVASAGDVNGDGYDDVVVGAPLYGPGDPGAAFLFLGSATGPSTAPDWAVWPHQAYASFGTSVASAGDVNGDGYDDVVIGAPFYGPDDGGAAFLFLGSATGLSATPDWTTFGHQTNGELGTSVASAGDVNGDGYDDVVVGAPLYGPGDPGAAFLFLGSALGPSATPDWTARGRQPGAWFGWSVASAGDVNGDGYADVIVGARFYGPDDGGAAFLFLGSATGPSAAPDWAALGHQTSGELGTSVASAGDVNDDGYDDVVVGAPLYGQGDAGAAFLFLGSAAGPSAAPDWTARGRQPGALFGWSVATAGDVNGDGYDDVMAGASAYDEGIQFDEGGALLFLGSATGPSGRPEWTADGLEEQTYFGTSVASAGDVNGDGYADVLAGAPGWAFEGAAFAWRGPL